MYFPSRKDSWLTILIWLFAFLFIIPPVFSPDFGVWLTPEFLDKQWIKIVVLWSVGFCLLWIWFKTGYTIKNDSLQIQSGHYKKEIDISEIRSIRKTNNPFTAPSLSIDRIEVNYGKYNTIQISPKNLDGFISELKMKKPHIQIKK
ncbi:MULTISPECIES: PH domain-containing protein [Bacillus]|uniref:PH domain-containing protein n=1 Tax=Bacillus TaxID=1386 RepID=UPI0028816782|nr:PH domain-containing protein [Bacillus sp. AG4(2022)]MDT0161209.1 PH domain-containing protein [Bacillus sp. AG4(2022)]